MAQTIELAQLDPRDEFEAGQAQGRAEAAALITELLATIDRGEQAEADALDMWDSARSRLEGLALILTGRDITWTEDYLTPYEREAIGS